MFVTAVKYNLYVHITLHYTWLSTSYLPSEEHQIKVADIFEAIIQHFTKINCVYLTSKPYLDILVPKHLMLFQQLSSVFDCLGKAVTLVPLCETCTVIKVKRPEKGDM